VEKQQESKHILFERDRQARNPAGRTRLLLVAIALLAMAIVALPAAGANGSMVNGERGWDVEPILTVGETLSGTSGALNPTTAGDYTPVGVLDGLGAYKLDRDTVRVFANHELGQNRGYDYEVSDGAGGTFTLDGARVSYFDIDKDTLQIVDAGLAYNTIYNANGNVASDASFLANNFVGFSRFCSAGLFEAHQFGGHRGGDDGLGGHGRGLEDAIFFTGEEDGGSFNAVGGAEWALDPETGNLWHVPDLGRGAWENVTILDTGSRNTVAVLLADDTSPFDADGDGVQEAAPLFLYVGEKDRNGDFPARNGLRGGTLHVWVAYGGATSPAEFNTSGKLSGRWVAIDNSRNLALADEFGAYGYDEYGYPTQRNLWSQAEALGAFGFSRPEDVATNPHNGAEFVLASTGVDTYVGGVDTFGTIYTMKTNFHNLRATLWIIYDGDADPHRRLRSPDNLDWADDGWIYIQEDKAENATLSGEPLFGPGAVNQNEAGIVRMKPSGSRLQRIANIDRSVVLDPTTAGTPVDVDAGDVGEWETSGILDVSDLFGERRGTLFLFDVQAHGIEDQTNYNPDSRINDDDLVEGGQLSFLMRH
jgi:hypothetical protein